MSDPPASEIDVFGQSFEVTDGSITLNHTMTVEQARALEAEYPSATGLQESIRSACRDGVQRRRELATVTEDDAVDRRILATLQSIEESLGD